MAPMYGASRAKQNALDWIGFHMEGMNGMPLGARVEDVFVDAATGAPRWLVATLGRFNHTSALVPSADVVAGAGHVLVPYEKSQIKEAPPYGTGSSISYEQEAALRVHYGLADRTDTAGFTPREVSAVRASAAPAAA